MSRIDSLHRALFGNQVPRPVSLLWGLLICCGPVAAAELDESPGQKSSDAQRVECQKVIPITRGIAREKEADIQRVLDEKLVTLAFNETPLREVVAFLHDVVRPLQVHVDQNALENLGLSLDERVTIHVEDITLRAALDLLLDPYDMAYTVAHQTLLIATEDDIMEHASIRLYPLHGLVSKDGFSVLVKIIQEGIEPTTWSEVGGEGTINIAGDVLVVTQCERVHHQVQGFLSALRQCRR